VSAEPRHALKYRIERGDILLSSMPKQPIRGFLLLLFFAATAPAAGNWRVGPEGVGPLRIGMTLSQNREALHRELKEDDPHSGSEDCFYVQSKKHLGTQFMILDGKLARTDVTEAGIFTPEGIQVGDSEAKVRKLYGSRVRVSAHQYFDNGQYLTVLAPDRRYGTRFETDNGKVTSYYAGLASAIEYVEGCL